MAAPANLTRGFVARKGECVAASVAAATGTVEPAGPSDNDEDPAGR